MINSMTAFARQEDSHEWGSLVCEIRSVNHRFLDIHIRMPEILRQLEGTIREFIRAQLVRGKIDLTLSFQKNNATSTLPVNQVLVDQILQYSQSIIQKMGTTAHINVIDLLAWPGVLQKENELPQAVHANIMTIVKQTLTTLVEMRTREGQALSQLMTQRLSQITELIRLFKPHQTKIISEQRAKLLTKIEALNLEPNYDRLEQELVYWAQKIDIAEELDRLEIHVDQAHHILNKGGAIGRRLDFLLQELNREANTLGSKAVNIETTQAAIDIKVFIEQLREQVQNIE